MRRKPIPTFLLHVAFLVVLIEFIPGSKVAIPAAVHSVGNTLFQSLGAGRSVRFKTVEPEHRRGRADTTMLGRRQGELAHAWRTTFNSHSRLIAPLATLAALMLATPMPRRRLAWALPVGSGLLFAFFMLQAAVLAMVFFGATQPAMAGEPSPWIDFIPISEAMFNTPIVNFSIVLMLWAALGAPTRGIDTAAFNTVLRRLLGPGRAATSSASGESPASAPADPPDDEAEAPR